MWGFVFSNAIVDGTCFPFLSDHIHIYTTFNLFKIVWMPISNYLKLWPKRFKKRSDTDGLKGRMMMMVMVIDQNSSNSPV